MRWMEGAGVGAAASEKNGGGTMSGAITEGQEDQASGAAALPYGPYNFPKPWNLSPSWATTFHVPPVSLLLP